MCQVSYQLQFVGIQRYRNGFARGAHHGEATFATLSDGVVPYFGDKKEKSWPGLVEEKKRIAGWFRIARCRISSAGVCLPRSDDPLERSRVGWPPPPPPGRLREQPDTRSCSAHIARGMHTRCHSEDNCVVVPLVPLASAKAIALVCQVLAYSKTVLQVSVFEL